MKTSLNPIEKAAEFIFAYDSFVAASHLNPEGDAIGALLGIKLVLESMGKTCYAYNGDPVPENTAFLPATRDIIRNIEEVPPVQAAIVLDCGDMERPGKDFVSFAGSLPLLNIDHHRTNTLFGDVNWVEPHASSTGEMIAKLVRHVDAEVTPDAALALYTAILTDTGSFQYDNTTAEALHAAARMVSAGARPEVAADNYYHKIPARNLLLLARCLDTLEFNSAQTRADMTLTSEMFEKTGTVPEAAEGFVNYITDVATVKAAALIREEGPSSWKISMRSKGEVDVAEPARRHKGGGHRNAAGFRMQGNLEEVKKLVRSEIDRELEMIEQGGAKTEHKPG